MFSARVHSPAHSINKAKVGADSRLEVAFRFIFWVIRPEEEYSDTSCVSSPTCQFYKQTLQKGDVPSLEPCSPCSLREVEITSAAHAFPYSLLHEASALVREISVLPW